MEGASSGEALPPGELCTQGGIYHVIHHSHRMPHKVLVRKGDRFPRCNGCGEAVRFRLIKHGGRAAAGAREARPQEGCGTLI